ncbi:hypothetical protein TIFTF001_021359 [Ficus carica]|uniref:Uncharacterized protein n=1 Tax=Ficus carica TaxID=3494 RepID=A0AA88AFT4_FICCA|nr:hypothetical protein TIFTF001_021359 [Ficus carica]
MQKKTNFDGNADLHIGQCLRGDRMASSMMAVGAASDVVSHKERERTRSLGNQPPPALPCANLHPPSLILSAIQPVKPPSQHQPPPIPLC